MRGYQPIGNYALIGDCHTAALVATDGSIDWCCWPRFDSEAVFCRILDADRGGFLSVHPTARSSSTRQYIDGTNVLETLFATGAGGLRVTDLMPVEPVYGADRRGEDVRTRHDLLRRLEALDGSVDVEVLCRPTFAFAAAETTLSVDGRTCVARHGASVLRIDGPWPWRLTGGGVAATAGRLASGAPAWVSLTYSDTGVPESWPAAECEAALQRTLAYWRAWSGRSTYAGPHAELVHRSALALKLLTYEPTGAVIAAPTTSLPEEVRGVRNWDYRFTWLRDASLTLEALMALGYHDEALDFWEWLQRLRLAEGNPLQIMYTIDGRSHLPERVLDHLAGYAGSRPVRVGNGAAGQRQLDIYGEVLQAAYVCVTGMHDQPHPEFGGVLAFLADRAASEWRLPDQGIWEVRSGPQHFVYSKLLCWVAVDRALRLAERGIVRGDTRAWQQARGAIRSTLLAEGFDHDLGAFVQRFGAPHLDASALVIPLLGFLPPEDPRVIRTIDRIQERLTSDGLVYRYLGADDGLPGGEATFVLCTFWLVEALAMAGRLDEAHGTFERIVSFANDVGLLAEEVDPTSGQLLGNFPQGFAHLALIRSAHKLQFAEQQRRQRA